MKAEVDDLIYMEDSRWYLGGLRSAHVKATQPHNDADVIKMNRFTFEDAMFLQGKKVTLEKIF
jgi:hypothetical protein